MHIHTCHFHFEVFISVLNACQLVPIMSHDNILFSKHFIYNLVRFVVNL